MIENNTFRIGQLNGVASVPGCRRGTNSQITNDYIIQTSPRDPAAKAADPRW